MSKSRNFLLENRRWIAGLALMIIVSSVLLYLVYRIEGDDTDLIVDEVFFNSIDMDGTDSDLKITVLLTNGGDDRIDDVMVRAFVIERDSNLARDESIVKMGNIPGKTTKEGELFISIPNNDTYRIEILVFEDSKLTLRGSGTIDLVGVGVASEYKGSNADSPAQAIGDWDIEDEGASTIMGLLCIMILPVSILVIIIVILVKGQKNKKDPVMLEKDEPDRAIPLKRMDVKKKDDEPDLPSIEEEDYGDDRS